MNASRLIRSFFQSPGRLLCGIVLAGLFATASASDVVLVPETPINDLGIGDIVELDVLINFSDIPGGTLGGGFDIGFDPAALTVSSVNSAGSGDLSMGREPDILAGLLESWAVGDFQGLAGAGQVLVGTVRFRIIATTGDSAQISVTPTDSLGGPWISGDDYISELAPNYNQVIVTFDPDSVYRSGFESP